LKRRRREKMVENLGRTGNGTGKAISANPGVWGMSQPHGQMKKR